MRIVGPNGAVLPEGRIGQLQVASARVTPGYLGNPDADRVAFPAGNWPARKWLATGDQAFITGGQVVITGRDSERIILNGQNYYAHDLEALASTAPGAEPGLVAACGIADATTGTDRLVIFYAILAETPTGPTDPPAGVRQSQAGLADSGAALTGSAAAFTAGVDEAIRAVLQDRLGLAAEVIGVPRRHFPTTPGGKILRPLLKQRWLDGTLETTTPYAASPRATASLTQTDRPVAPLTAAERASAPPNEATGTPAAAAGTSSAATEHAAAALAGTDSSAVTRTEEDASERTTELPIVRLAWRRTLQDSIPVPPSRPTYGANRPTEDPLDADPTEHIGSEHTEPAAEHTEPDQTEPDADHAAYDQVPLDAERAPDADQTAYDQVPLDAERVPDAQLTAPEHLELDGEPPANNVQAAQPAEPTALRSTPRRPPSPTALSSTPRCPPSPSALSSTGRCPASPRPTRSPARLRHLRPMPGLPSSSRPHRP